MPDDATHKHLQSIDYALSSDPGVLPHVVGMAGNGFVSNGLESSTPLTDSRHLVDALLDFAETQSEDMCYWSYQSLPPPTGDGPTYWDMQTGQWDNDIDWVRAYGEVAYSRLHSLIEPGGSVVGAMCAMGSEMTKRQCARGIEADKGKCIPQLLESELTWPMAIAIFKVDGGLLETIRNWRGNASLHLANIEWTFGGGSRPAIWNTSVPGVGDVDPAGMPHGGPWPTSQGRYWGSAPGQQMIAKAVPCSQIPDKFRYSSELLYCDHVAEGASISTPDEGYAVWESLVSVWPPTKPCSDNVSALNAALQNMGMSAVQNCNDGMQAMKESVPNFNCDTTSMFGSSLFRDLCCSECGGEPIPDMSSPAPAPAHVCSVCGHVYDADQDGGGAAMEDLPDSWVCPVCGAPKSKYSGTIASELSHVEVLV